MNHNEQSRSKGKIPAGIGWAVAGFLAIAAFFLLTEHRAHLLGALPWLLLLACPFLHFFMHGSHGSGHGGHAGQGARPPDSWKGEKP